MTDAPRPQALVRAAFSFPVMLASLLALLTVITCSSRFNDIDTWSHLKVGESIWKTHSVPRTDEFSFTTGKHPFIAHEWLSQLAIYCAYRLGGYSGMLLWLCGLASLLVVLVYALCSVYSGNSKISLLGGIMGLFFATVGLAIRPLLLGYTFLVIELLIVHLARTRNRRWLWALPPLFVVWVNCHGSYLLGLLVLGIVICCSFVRLRAGLLISEGWPKPERDLLCGIFLLCLAALFCNPIGIRLLTYPIDVFTRQTRGLANTQEWHALSIVEPRGLAVLGVAGCIALIMLLGRPVVRLEELALLALSFAMALRHMRMVFIFGIIAAPILCRLLADAWERYDPARDLRAANALLIATSLFLMVRVFPKPAEIDRQIRQNNPVDAVRFIRETRLTGPMLNDQWWGGYLMWALPEEKVFIDGRSDVFDWSGVLADYLGWSRLTQDPSVLLNKYGIRLCVLSRSHPMTFVMPYVPGWQKVYIDSVSVIFTRTSPPPQPPPAPR